MLAVLQLMGAVLMNQMYRAQDFAEFYPYVVAYMIAYMPTLAMVNSISFASSRIHRDSSRWCA
jgi:hypothetical protein